MDKNWNHIIDGFHGKPHGLEEWSWQNKWTQILAARIFYTSQWLVNSAGHLHISIAVGSFGKI